MTLPKFVICMDGTFRLGQVNQHKNLLKPGDQCIGGGYYHFDFISNRIILDRESYDFGRPKWHLLEVLKVPSTYRGMRIVYKYDDGFHDDFNVSEELQIKYFFYDLFWIIKSRTPFLQYLSFLPDTWGRFSCPKYIFYRCRIASKDDQLHFYMRVPRLQ